MSLVGGNAWVIRAVVGLAGLASAALAVNLGLTLTRPAEPLPGPPSTAAKPSRGAVVAEAAPLNRYQALWTGRVFSGDPRATDAAKTTDLPRLEGFRLVGVVAGSKERSWAVVEESGTGRQELIGLGQALGLGKVVEIRPGLVVVETAGQRRQLTLLDQSLEQLAGIISIRGDQFPWARRAAEGAPEGLYGGPPLIKVEPEEHPDPASGRERTPGLAESLAPPRPQGPGLP